MACKTIYTAKCLTYAMASCWSGSEAMWYGKVNHKCAQNEACYYMTTLFLPPLLPFWFTDITLRMLHNSSQDSSNSS